MDFSIKLNYQRVLGNWKTSSKACLRTGISTRFCGDKSVIKKTMPHAVNSSSCFRFCQGQSRISGLPQNDGHVTCWGHGPSPHWGQSCFHLRWPLVAVSMKAAFNGGPGHWFYECSIIRLVRLVIFGSRNTCWEFRKLSSLGLCDEIIWKPTYFASAVLEIGGYRAAWRGMWRGPEPDGLFGNFVRNLDQQVSEGKETGSEFTFPSRFD